MNLYNGDCLEILKDISSNSVDLIICDLPFGCLAGGDAVGKGKERRRASGLESSCSWDVKLDLEKFWTEIRRIRKDDHTPCLHFCTTKYGFELWESNKKEFRYDLVWDKGRGVSFLSANKMPMRSHEMIYVFSQAGSYYNRIDISGTPYVTSGNSGSTTYSKDWKQRHEPKTISTRCVLSVLQNPMSSGKDRHPTEKPKELYKFLIERYCPIGGTVLDPTFGSGNSGLAARDLGRKYIGIEKDKAFFDKAKKKLLPD